MRIKIEFKNQLRSIPFVLTLVVLLFLVALSVDFDPSALWIFSALVALFCFPAAFLHIEYFLKNRGQVIEVENGTINVKKNDGRVISYNKEEIEKIKLYKSASADQGGIPLSPMEFYFYARIIPKSNAEDIIITCLMIHNMSELLDKEFEGVTLERYKTFFASLRYPLILPDLFGTSTQ